MLRGKAGAEEAKRQPGCALQLPVEGKGVGGARQDLARRGEIFLHRQGGQAPGQASGRARVPKAHRTEPSFPPRSKGKTVSQEENGEIGKILRYSNWSRADV